MSTSEQWKPIAGYEGYYQVSDLGRVRSMARVIPEPRWGARRQPAKIHNPWLSHGYPNVTLHRDGIRQTRIVHRLVLEAFVGPCPEGMEGCHNDGNPRNNRLDNLRWDTPLANNLDVIRHGNNLNVNKTHCPEGHPYDAAHTYRAANGKRHCRECNRLAVARYRRRQKEAQVSA